MFRSIARTLLLVGSLTGAALFSSAVAAQNIAVFNIQAGILQSTPGQAALAALEEDATFKALVTEAQTLLADIQALEKDAQANSQKWQQDKDAAKIGEYQRQRQFLAADLELNNKKIQAERERVVRQLINRMRPAAAEALQEIIKDEKISLLLDHNAVHHAADAHNITVKLAARLSK